MSNLTHTLLDQATKLNRALESNYLALAVTLTKIRDTKAYEEAGFNNFLEYATQDLGRHKSTVSQLVTVGEWIEKNGLRPETLDVPHKTLYGAITLEPEADPKRTLSMAKTLTTREIEDERKEKKFGVHDCDPDLEKIITIAPCKVCHKSNRVYADPS